VVWLRCSLLCFFRSKSMAFGILDVLCMERSITLVEVFALECQSKLPMDNRFSKLTQERPKFQKKFLRNSWEIFLIGSQWISIVCLRIIVIILLMKVCIFWLDSTSLRLSLDSQMKFWTLQWGRWSNHL
jgi:hypothetical protein